MWELDHKEGSKNWCFQIVALEKTLESPLDSKEIKPVNPKGNKSWIFIGRTDAKAEAPILWPLDEKSQLLEKDPDAGRGGVQEAKGVTEDEMIWRHHWLNGHEFGQTPGDSAGQKAWCDAIHGVTETWTQLLVVELLPLQTLQHFHICCFSFFISPVYYHTFISRKFLKRETLLPVSGIGRK